MSKINYQALRLAAEQAMHDDWGFDADLFHELVTPSIVLALLDERERNQQYIKSRDQENEDIALTVGKLRVELEAAKSKLNEQREYYEGVIAYGGKRIAELVAELVSQTYKLNEMSGNSPVTPSVWMSCSERMPDDAQWCVVEAADGYYVQCWSEGQGWLGDDISLRNCDVIRWMMIPEPPEQDGE
ncbi:TPA: ead/Ea22-like family protein [Escherichia coli]